MRVVHLSTYESAGGAARAAHGLHQGLVAAGVDSHMLVMERQSGDARVHLAPRDLVDARLESLCAQHWCASNRTDLSNTAFSLGFASCEVAGHDAVQAADVINLHWVPRLLDARSLAALRALGKPVVWTLHDEWAYTGGCHYAAGCGKWRDECRDCPQIARDPHGLVELRFAQKAAACADGAMTVVAPSRWLARNAQESAVFRGSRVEVVPYGVDLCVFSPERRAAGRARLDASQDDFVILFSAEAAFERRKGFAELASALGMLRTRAVNPDVAASHIKLAVLGHGYGVALPEGSLPLGHVASREELAEIVAASDLYVMPSLEDNLPNGVLEALASGTPCVGFDIGGVPDMLADAPGCALAPVADSGALAAQIASVVSGGLPTAELRGAIRAFAEKRYAPARQAEAYLAIYRSLVAGKVRAA